MVTAALVAAIQEEESAETEAEAAVAAAVVGSSVVWLGAVPGAA